MNTRIDDEQSTDAEQSVLATLTAAINRDALSHALLLCGAPISKLCTLTKDIVAPLLCASHQNAPCAQCQSCHLLTLDIHPDLTTVKPEKRHSPIKIDQIRELMDVVYTSPKLGSRRVIVIYPAEKMNQAAGNALLKLLEEPPEGVYFILAAVHLSTLLPTIISRCQVWRLPEFNAGDNSFSALLDALCDQDDVTALVKQDIPIIVDDLVNVMKNEKSICEVAANWLKYDFFALMTIIYILNAHLIKVIIMDIRTETFLNELIPYCSAASLFRQQDKINGILDNLNHNINMNSLLTIEHLLMNYVSSTGAIYE